MGYTRVFVALAFLAFTGGVLAGATGAFFSDEEISTSNTFAAGEIDLQVANESYATDSNGILAASPATSWGYDDVLGLFFNFTDLKPGDYGEDTIRLRVRTNPAWLCAYVTVTENRDATCNEPEREDDPTCDENGVLNGELAQHLSVLWWADDGDNVLEDDEEVITLARLGDAPVGTQLPVVLADSSGNIFDSQGGPVEPGVEYAIGKGWCFGNMSLTPLAQDGQATQGPLLRGTGFQCDGSQVDNAPQTDEVMLTVAFYAEQARHNSGFTCEGAIEPASTTHVGSALSEHYAPPPTCDVEVDDDADADYTTIAEALQDTAHVPDGSVVCVDTGTYGPFTVDRPITIAGLHNPLTPAAAVVEGTENTADSVLIASSNVVLQGLKVHAPQPVGASQVAAVRVSPPLTFGGDDIENVVISQNVVGPVASAAGSGASVKGIQLWTEAGSGTTFRTIAIEHNRIEGIHAQDGKGSYGIQTVGALENVAVRFNTLSAITSNGWGAGVALDAKEPIATGNVVVERNHIMGMTAPVVGVQVEANVDAAGIRITHNNLESLLYGGSSSVPSTAVLNAENNWWGDTDPSDDVFVNPATNVVDYLPFQTVPYPQW